jgi:hypothetical protein
MANIRVTNRRQIVAIKSSRTYEKVYSSWGEAQRGVLQGCILGHCVTDGYKQMPVL